MNARPIFILFVLLAGLVAAAPSSYADMTPDAALQKARSLSEQKKYDDALRLLSKTQKKDPASVEIHLAIAQNLSWKGDYAAAQKELDKIGKAERQDPDVQLVQANLYYYQGKLKKAGDLFSKILKDYPDYADAASGLRNVRRAQAAPENDAFLWQIDTGLEISAFARSNQTNWNQEFFQLSRFLNDRKTVLHGGVTRYDQFSDIDSEYNIGVDHVFSPVFSGYVATAVSPNALFRPDWLVTLGGALRLDDPQKKNWPVWLTLDTKRDDYSNTQIMTFTPGLRVEPADQWAVSLRLITISQRNEKRLYGQELRVNGQIADGWRFTAAYADAPETQAGITVNTKTIYGGMTVDIGPAHTLRFGYTRDDREHSYIRNAYNVGVSYRF